MSIIYGEEGWLICIADSVTTENEPDGDRIYIYTTQLQVSTRFQSQLLTLPAHYNIHIPTGEVAQSVNISQGVLLKFSMSDINSLWQYIHSHGSGTNAPVYVFIKKDDTYLQFIDKDGNPQNYLKAVFRDVSISFSANALPKIKISLAEVSI